ncbi:uncharacterized protein LOC113205482 [Frankliniella occidentalis]|uniref:Uncharacterized protein LOC113205482 n=1 Tax=Frankliniella occidentalis TaxID=133901 RepID=A0A9C6X370_FRAOC|nr:uncharacterized protein LOC113205482 [Frankliniella occidentalis]
MLSYMIPPSEDAAGKSGNGGPHAQQVAPAAMSPAPGAGPGRQQPLVHKARGRVQQRPGVEPPPPPPPPPSTNGHHAKNGGTEPPVNGQHHSAATTIVVNDGGQTTTTTTFSSTSNINGTVHTTKKIIKTYREQPAMSPASYGGMSTESSASSLSTAASEQGDKPKPKLLANGTKNPGLKRVSFGSSKGSMVETLIYESPLQEEPELVTPTGPVIDPAIIENDPSGAAGADRVRVSFFECSKPQVVEGGDALTPEDLDAPDGMAADSNSHGYVRQNSTDSGWDNPFRPDGDLSREADEIVELIKGGKPITPTPLGPAPPGSPAREAALQAQHSSPVTSTPHKNGANGSANKDAAKPSSPGNVDVTRGTVSGGESAQVEHVTLKKKPKCKCCIVQ